MKKYLCVLSLILLTSCDNALQDNEESYMDAHSKKVENINNLFNENDLSIIVKEVKPANEELIQKVISVTNENALAQKKPDFKRLINWNEMEVLTIENYEGFVTISEVSDITTSNEEYNILLTLFNETGVYYGQTFLKTNNKITTDGTNSELVYSFEDLGGKCSSFKDIKSAKIASSIPLSEENNQGEGCWGGCVEETVQEGTPAFLLVCMGTGPYCAAAIAIACGGCCATSDDCPPS